jgi:uncharacterized protein (TIGR02145 family)
MIYLSIKTLEFMEKSIYSYLFIYLTILFSVSLNGQAINNNEVEKATSSQRNASFNVEEIKVRWKKAALENCTGVPCVIFTCGTSIITDIDNNTYNTVSIGSQCWTKENLKVTKYNDGSLIPDSTNSTWGTATVGARTEFNPTDPDVPPNGYVGTYGYLYNWYAVNDARNLCPKGWHVPSDAEWTTMIQTLDPSQLVISVNDVLTYTGPQSFSAGDKLKSNSNLWNTNTGTNDYNFSALPGGFRAGDGTSFNIKSTSFFWSVTESDTFNAWYRFLDHSNGIIERYNFTMGYVKPMGFSVRCLKD